MFDTTARRKGVVGLLALGLYVSCIALAFLLLPHAVETVSPVAGVVEPRVQTLPFAAMMALFAASIFLAPVAIILCAHAAVEWAES